jgi:hypothetical protein
MKNKNLLIGGAVVAGALLFLYFRNKQSNGEDQDLKDAELGGGVGSGTGLTTTGTGTTTGAGSGSTTTTTGTGTGTGAGSGSTTPPITQLTKFELEARMLKACGVRPLVKGARRNLYNDCLAREKAILRQQGLISFDGSSDGVSDNQRGRLDFGNNVD